jgi:hypothetical protein
MRILRGGSSGRIRMFREEQHPLVCGRTFLERKLGGSCDRKMRGPTRYERSLNSVETAAAF